MGGNGNNIGPEWLPRPAGFPVPDSPPVSAAPQDPLERAEAIDPGNPFVASCRKFFTERGYLSTKQITALDNVTRTRGRRRLDLVGNDIGAVLAEDPDQEAAYWEDQADWYDLTIGE